MTPRLPLILELLWLAAPTLLAPLGACASEENSSFSLNCTNVPYPFGNSGEALKGFEISCNGTSPFLQLDNNAFLIEHISVQEDYVIINFAVSVCTCGVGDFSDTFDLEGTPYTILADKVKGNVLTTVGCGGLGIIQGLGHHRNSTSGCLSFCSSLNFTIDRPCAGLGCCQAPIPKGLKKFNLTLRSLSNLTGLGLDTPIVNLECGQAFLAKRNSFTFSREELQYMMNSSQPLQTNFSIVLDWAIGSETCEKAKDQEIYACKQNSDCHNSINGVGYRCICRQGYQGNPYVGCTDIDECQTPGLNPCVGLCINEPGNVSCACPHGQYGDGKKQGSGCHSTVLMKRSMVPLELGLGLGLSLLFILIIGSLWSYWFSRKRKLVQMKAKFFNKMEAYFSSNKSYLKVLMQ